MSILPADGSSESVIGSEEGSITFTMNPGTYWPVYGGRLVIYTTWWYGEDTESVFTDET